MRRPNSFGKRGLTALIGVALTLPACAEDAPQDYLQPVGEIAKQIDTLWDLVFLIAAVVFFLVEGLLVYTLIRFRRREGVEAKQFHGNTKVEVILTIIPALILAGIAIPTLRTLFDVTSEPTGANVLRITVTGHQFWWEYDYPDFDVKTANELHIPTDTDVRLTLLGDTTNVYEGGARDVIHAFWVPRLAGKQDVVPGREAKMTLRVNEPGEFLGQCAEFCGLSHSNMRLKVYAHRPFEFQQWLAEQQAPAQDPTDPMALEGQELFLGTEAAPSACVGCHAIGGTDASGTVGPNLTHFASRTTFAGATFARNEENLAAWLADPPGVKPGSRMPDLDLSQDQIQKLIAYLQSLE